MTAMIGRTAQGSRTGAIVLCCVMAAAALAGCSPTTAGKAVQAPGTPPESALASTSLLALILDGSGFPADYPAADVQPADTDGALAMADGVPEGARVSPPDCAPETPREAVAVQGARDATELLVVLARGVGPLSARRDQAARCSSYSVDTNDGGSWDVSVQMLPAPVVNVDDAFAVQRTQRGGGSSDSLTLVGQIGPIRVTAQTTGPPGEELDTAVLDSLFTAQVQKLRRAE